MKAGFQQAQRKRKWWSDEEPMQDLRGEGQCSELMTWEGVTYFHLET